MGQFNIPADQIAKFAVGPEHYPEPLTEWETLLAEIITGDAFGADRMDYLLRDSYHAGVAYGKFEHHRLIDSMRILPNGEAEIPALGIEQGGIQSAESLLWARYLMYTQLYFHHVRRILLGESGISICSSFFLRGCRAASSELALRNTYL